MGEEEGALHIAHSKMPATKSKAKTKDHRQNIQTIED
jgi:hypothetical protein